MRMDKRITDEIKRHCSQSELARACNVKPQAVSQWFAGVRPIPAKYCAVIEAVTEGEVRAEQLRPDLDWVRTKTGLSVRF